MEGYTKLLRVSVLLAATSAWCIGLSIVESMTGGVGYVLLALGAATWPAWVMNIVGVLLMFFPLLLGLGWAGVRMPQLPRRGASRLPYRVAWPQRRYRRRVQRVSQQ